MKWFKHDADANRDPKLEKLMMRYGAEGYALYWLCIELIAAPIDSRNLSFELEHDAEILAYRLKMDSVKVEEIMKYMVGLDLFEMSATRDRITCLKLATRIENSVVKNPKLKQIQSDIKSGKCPEEVGVIPNHPESSRAEPDVIGKLGLDKIRLDKEKTHTSVSPPPDDSKSPPCPHEGIIKIYHEILPELPRVVVSRWSGAKRTNLQTRWRESPKHQTSKFWRQFFAVVRSNDHWMTGSGSNWRPTLAWFVKRENFDKVYDLAMNQSHEAAENA